MKRDVGTDNVNDYSLHLNSLILGAAGEMKTKPTHTVVSRIKRIGVFKPNILDFCAYCERPFHRVLKIS